MEFIKIFRDAKKCTILAGLLWNIIDPAPPAGFLDASRRKSAGMYKAFQCSCAPRQASKSQQNYRKIVGIPSNFQCSRAADRPPRLLPSGFKMHENWLEFLRNISVPAPPDGFLDASRRLKIGWDFKRISKFLRPWWVSKKHQDERKILGILSYFQCSCAADQLLRLFQAASRCTNIDWNSL